MSDYVSSQWKVNNFYGRVETRSEGRFIEHYGSVPTIHGFVSVSSYQAPSGWTMLRFIWQGHCHERLWREQGFRPRYLVTLAKRFADDVVNGGDNA